MLQQIKQKIKECEQIIYGEYQSPAFREKIGRSDFSIEEIANEFNDKEVGKESFKKTFASLVMQKNQAIANLEKLLIQSRDYILEKTKVYVIEANPTVEELSTIFKNKKCFVLNHKSMAYRIAHVLMPAVRINDVFSGNLMAILNDILDGVEREIGVVSEMTPRIEMRQDCMHTITSVDSLADSIEYMLETQMYPSSDVKEGHFLQALYNRVQYLNMTYDVEDESALNCVIVAPKVSQCLIDEYSRFFSPNVVFIKNGFSELLSYLPSIVKEESFEESQETDEFKSKRKYSKKLVA